MDIKSCTHKIRANISNDLKHQLAKESNFACSICGKIPIVFHHIEEWSKEYSNDARVLIPICDLCHRRIHGEGGCLFSKDELYEFKNSPRRPAILTDSLPLGKKNSYSFFIGNNFIANGRRANLFLLPDGNHLTSIDISDGNLKLSILRNIVDGKLDYLIKENELMIDQTDIWDMRYSGNSLKIWSHTGGKKNILIDLIIKPSLIIIKRMETTFNGKPLRIHRLRAPDRRMAAKLQKIIHTYEEKYKEISEQIDLLPREYEGYGHLDIEAFVKQTQKDIIKRRFKQAILYDHSRELRCEWPYYLWAVDKLCEKSDIFSSGYSRSKPISTEYEKMIYISLV